MLVVHEEGVESGGVRLKVLMKRVAVSRTAGGVEQAAGIRCRQGWHRHRMSRKQLVGITGLSAKPLVTFSPFGCRTAQLSTFCVIASSINPFGIGCN